MSIDVDKLMQNPVATLEKVINDICDYVQVSIDEISYTTNFSITTGSHHIVVLKYYMKSSDQNVFWKTLEKNMDMEKWLMLMYLVRKDGFVFLIKLKKEL